MKGLVSALAAASLLISPLTAVAQTHSGAMRGGHAEGGRGEAGHGDGDRDDVGHASGGHAEGGRGEAGERFERFGGGGFRDHDRGGFEHRFRHFDDDDDFFPFFGGFAFGLALDPWFYGDYWGPWGPYYDRWSYDYYDGPPPPRGSAPPPVCGEWTWRGDENRYEWTTSPCAAAAPAPPTPAQPPPPPQPPST